jgi:hypothetical protein
MPIKYRYVTRRWQRYNPSTGKDIDPGLIDQIRTIEVISYDNSPNFPVLRNNQCFHTKMKPASGNRAYKSSTSTREIDFPGSLDHIAGMRDQVQFNSNISPPKIDADSSFGIIQFFAELDETIATFVSGLKDAVLSWLPSVPIKGLKRSSKGRAGSYGLYEWSVIPIYNDIKNLITAFHRIAHILEGHDPSEPPKSIRFSSNAPSFSGKGNGFIFDYEVTTQYIGTLVPSTVLPSKLAGILRNIGFDLDLSILWDLTPYSFVIEYVLPWVSDFLSDISPLLAAVKWKFSGVWIVKLSGSQTFGDTETITVHGTSFARRITTQTLSTADIGWQYPSVKESLNSLYLLIQKRRH